MMPKHDERSTYRCFGWRVHCEECWLEMVLLGSVHRSWDHLVAQSRSTTGDALSPRPCDWEIKRVTAFMETATRTLAKITQTSSQALGYHSLLHHVEVPLSFAHHHLL